MTNNLPPDLATFVQSAVTAGEYASPDEVVVAGLRLLQERRERDRREQDESVRQALQEGIDQLDRGEYTAFENMDDFQKHVQEMLRHSLQRADAKKNSA